MQIITAESEASFVDFLDVVQKNLGLWMCIHVQMSSLNEDILNAEGLSRKALEKMRQISSTLAKKMHDDGLSPLEGRIFVFEDSDIFALFSCDDHARQQLVDKLSKEFASQGLSNLFNPYPLKDKMGSLVTLSRKKIESAHDYTLKKKAVSTAENIFGMTEPDRDLQIALQTKRRQHAAPVILIIEDDMVTRGIIAATFKKGYTVIQAKDAKSGITAHIAHAPNVVFLDIHLPDHNGKLVLDRLKFIDPAAYIVMISTDSVADNILSTHAKGSAGFIKKPFSKEKIIQYAEKCPIKVSGIATFEHDT